MGCALADGGLTRGQAGVGGCVACASAFCSCAWACSSEVGLLLQSVCGRLCLSRMCLYVFLQSAQASDAMFAA